MEEPKTEKLIKLSASRTQTFEKCERKYFYHYIQHLPTKEWPHLTLGTYVHAVLELFHKRFRDADPKPDNLRVLMGGAASDAHKKMVSEGKTLGSDQLKEAKGMLSDYLSRMLNEGMPNVLEVEHPFTLSLNDKYDLTGVVDRIDMGSDGLLHIFDYKTTKSAKYMDDFQLKTYGVYLLDRYPDLKRFHASYIMLRLGGRPLAFEFTREDAEACRGQLIRWADRIMSEERWMTRPSKLCDWCDYKEVCLNSW